VVPANRGVETCLAIFPESRPIERVPPKVQTLAIHLNLVELVGGQAPIDVEPRSHVPARENCCINVERLSGRWINVSVGQRIGQNIYRENMMNLTGRRLPVVFRPTVNADNYLVPFSDRYSLRFQRYIGA